MRIPPKSFDTELKTWFYVTSVVKKAAVADPEHFRKSVGEFLSHYGSRAEEFKAQFEIDLGPAFTKKYITGPHNKSNTNLFTEVECLQRNDKDLGVSEVCSVLVDDGKAGTN